MQCSQFGAKLWDAYVNDVISDQQLQLVNSHLLNCSHCNRMLNAIETENALIGIGLRAVPLQRMSISAGELVEQYSEKLAIPAATPAVSECQKSTHWPARLWTHLATLAEKVL
jgi:hypothetical protein